MKDVKVGEIIVIKNRKYKITKRGFDDPVLRRIREVK